MTAADSPAAGLTRLHAQRSSSADPARLAEQLSGGGGWLGEPTPLSDGRTRYIVDLRLEAGHGPLTLRKAAIVELGAPRRTDDQIEFDISWYAAGLAPLFPVFSGSLQLGSNTVALDGYYAPPGGAVGQLADRVLLHTAAQRTAEWVARQIADSAS